MTILLLIITTGLCVCACSKKTLPPLSQNKFQAKKTESTGSAKNYVLCKQCIPYQDSLIVNTKHTQQGRMF
ncbi:MAG: hypothetical protein A3F13_03480 [Gammaproteobacteria bacterium RIFCSPHIGHO2_12_FULL_40_19]|nr:MAG: hypothetical protein A3F13_03480 [Gammaproteobacteria bacterium RIFCSPHIGHO2_12_FULL_40_19]